MSELLHTLGIDWKLLIGQAVTFGLLLIILRFSVYKPLLDVMRKRRERIEHGLKGADEIDKRLGAIEQAKEQKLAKADQQALAIVSKAEDTAKERSNEMISGAQNKANYLLKEAAKISKQKEQEQMAKLYKEAQGLIRDALSKTVELDPKLIDEKLINEAITIIKGRA